MLFWLCSMCVDFVIWSQDACGWSLYVCVSVKWLIETHLNANFQYFIINSVLALGMCVCVYITYDDRYIRINLSFWLNLINYSIIILRSFESIIYIEICISFVFFYHFGILNWSTINGNLFTILQFAYICCFCEHNSVTLISVN